MIVEFDNRFVLENACRYLITQRFYLANDNTHKLLFLWSFFPRLVIQR